MTNAPETYDLILCGGTLVIGDGGRTRNAPGAAVGAVETVIVRTADRPTASTVKAAHPTPTAPLTSIELPRATAQVSPALPATAALAPRAVAAEWFPGSRGVDPETDWRLSDALRAHWVSAIHPDHPARETIARDGFLAFARNQQNRGESYLGRVHS